MTKTGKPRCMGTLEWHTHTSYWTDCVLEDGHLGPCMDCHQSKQHTVKNLAPVRVEAITARVPAVGWDADGRPCE